MTLFNYILLGTNLILLFPIYYLMRKNDKLETENQELLLDTVKFAEETLREIDKLQVSLEDCKKKQVSKSKKTDDEKKTTSK